MNFRRKTHCALFSSLSAGPLHPPAPGPVPAEHVGQGDGIKLLLQFFGDRTPDLPCPAVMAFAAPGIIGAALRQSDASVHQPDNAAQGDVIGPAVKIVAAHGAANTLDITCRLQRTHYFFHKLDRYSGVRCQPGSGDWREIRIEGQVQKKTGCVMSRSGYSHDVLRRSYL